MAVIKDTKVLVIDTSNGVRVDLSSVGANPTQDTNNPLPPPTLTFSYRGQIIFVRSLPAESAVVAFDLITRAEQVLFRTTRRVWRLETVADEDKVHVLEFDPTTSPSPEIRTTLAPRHCRGAAASYSTFGPTGSFTDHVVPIPTPRDRFPAEALHGSILCTEDNHRVMLTTDGSEVLVATRKPGDKRANLGPLQWVIGRTPRCADNVMKFD